MMLQRQARSASPAAPTSGGLAINRVGDRYEREADRAAELVMSGNRGVRPTISSIAPGLKAKLVYEGPVQKPTSVSLKLTSKSGASVTASYTSTPASGDKPAEQKAGLTLSIPLGGSSDKKKGPTDAEKFRAETARI